MVLQDLFCVGISDIIDYVTIDIYLIQDDLVDIISKTGRKVTRRSVVCVLANKYWSDREVQKYAEHEIDHFEYYSGSINGKLYVYLKGDLEI